MTEFVEPVPASEYGRQRRAEWLAGLQANADMASAAEMQAHQQDHNTVTAGQAGIFGQTSPQQMAATVAARAATVGTGTDAGRPLERHPVYTHHLEGPCPPQADRRRAGQTGPDPDALSPTLRYLRGQ